MSKRICIIDGQGGGIGATLIKYLKEAYGESVVLIALGTNAIANKGASGESAVCRTVFQVDCFLGPSPLPGPTPYWAR